MNIENIYEPIRRDIEMTMNLHPGVQVFRNGKHVAISRPGRKFWGCYVAARPCGNEVRLSIVRHGQESATQTTPTSADPGSLGPGGTIEACILLELARL